MHLATEASGIDDESPKMTMLYKVNSGAAEEVNYGLKLARVVGFPLDFMQLAEHVSNSLQKQMEEKRQSSQSRKVALKRKLILNLYETLKQMRDSDMEDDTLGSYMKRLQTEFVVRMDEIEQGGQVESDTGEMSSAVEAGQSGSESEI